MQELAPHFGHWEKLKDIIDQLLDIMLDYRQSGHPGGSRSKVQALVVLTLSGMMRWDIRHPEKRFRRPLCAGRRSYQPARVRNAGCIERGVACEVPPDR